MLRRKGLAVADAQRMPERPEPWYMALTWNEKEERSCVRWFQTYIQRTLEVPRERVAKETSWWLLDAGLHRRDICTRADHHHDETREADLPRRHWLPLRDALATVLPELWPTHPGAEPGR